MLTSDRAKEQNGKGFSLVCIHRYEDALACLEEAVRLDPKDAEAHENKALCLGVFGRNDEALACFEEAVGLGTGDPAATHVNMGQCLLGLRRNGEALASFEATLGLEPGHLISTYFKGICLAYLQRNEEARACLEPIMGLLAVIAVISTQQTIAISEDISQRVNEPKMVDFLDNMVKETGTTVTTHPIENSTSVTITNNVARLSDNAYEVHSLATYQGNTINDETVIVTQNDDGTVKMVNERRGFNVVFSKSDNDAIQNGQSGISVSGAPPALHPLGRGSSDTAGAKVTLRDEGYKLTFEEQLNLEDTYSQCGLRDYETHATVHGNDYSTRVFWSADLFYFHWCLVGHTVDHGKISFEGESHNWSGTYYREADHTFTHGSNTGQFTLDAEIWYGDW